MGCIFCIKNQIFWKVVFLLLFLEVEIFKLCSSSFVPQIKCCSPKSRIHYFFLWAVKKKPANTCPIETRMLQGHTKFGNGWDKSVVICSNPLHFYNGIHDPFLWISKCAWYNDDEKNIKIRSFLSMVMWKWNTRFYISTACSFRKEKINIKK